VIESEATCCVSRGTLSTTHLLCVIRVQLKAYLANCVDRLATSAVAEAHQWIADARSKVTWCAKTDGDGVDCDGIEARLTVITDLCNSVYDGELIRDTALRRAQIAIQAASDSDASHWSRQCQQLNDDWTEFTGELQHTRWFTRFKFFVACFSNISDSKQNYRQ